MNLAAVLLLAILAVQLVTASLDRRLVRDEIGQEIMDDNKLENHVSQSTLKIGRTYVPRTQELVRERASERS